MPTPYPVPHRFRWYALAGLGLLGLGTAALRPAAAGPDEVIRRLVQGVQSFYADARPEKAYLHLDQDGYAAGETVWFGAYLVDGQQHRPDSLSRVLHVELVSDRRQVVLRQALHLAGGRAPGALALPDTLAPGTYLLRAYTDWMRNAGPDYFYQRRLQVWPAAGPTDGPDARAATRATAAAARAAARRLGAPPDVQFFPEGGSLVEGLESTVAFKAVDYAGHGLDVAGQVLDAQDRPVATFRSAHLGMGTFQLVPQPGQRYRAVVALPQEAPLVVPLPAAQASGYALHVTPEPNAFRVSIRQRGAPSGRVLLLAQVRGAVGYLGQGSVAGPDAFMVRIPRAKFAAGIVHFTVFDGEGVPQAERLAFAPETAPLRVALAPDRAAYGPREPVHLRVAVTDAAGHPVGATRLSVAVADAAGAGAETIASHLLLTSDLVGYVEGPGYYFQNPTAETAGALDDLLLTQGWRRFAWKDVLAGPRPRPEFGAAQSLGVRGQVLTPGGKPVPNGKLVLLRSAPHRLVLPATTTDQGRFLFNGLNGCGDTTRFTLQARTARGSANVVVRLDAGPPVPPVALPPLPLLPTPAELIAVQNAQAAVAADRRFRLDTANSVVLGAVNVKANKRGSADSRRLYDLANASVLRMDDLPLGESSLTVFQVMQGRVAGLDVTGTDPNVRVQIRGPFSTLKNNQPLFLLDGTSVWQDALNFFPAHEVESIEVLKGPAAAVYGSRAAGGVVAIFTRRGGNSYRPVTSGVATGLMAVSAPGYACPRQFYQPRYDRPQPTAARPDPRRRTLYWNPDVRTNAAGEAELTFYTADAAGRFQLVAQGVSAAGQPALGRGALQVALRP
ncbi:MAG: TonB-dependent receptor plug domain-containing protein [Janthinobacterium lividum]